MNVCAFTSGKDALSGLSDEVVVMAKTAKIALAALCWGVGNTIGGTLGRALGSSEGGEGEDDGNGGFHCYM